MTINMIMLIRTAEGDGVIGRYPYQFLCLGGYLHIKTTFSKIILKTLSMATRHVGQNKGDIASKFL